MASKSTKPPDSEPVVRGPTQSVAYLLSKLGSDAGTAFARRLEPLGLEPRHIGILRIVAGSNDETQLELSGRLGIGPGRMVKLLDDLEQRGLVERRVHPEDRRARVLQLTAAGKKMLGRANAIGMEHERETCAPLTVDERAQLLGLLQRLANASGDGAIDVHPGLRS